MVRKLLGAEFDLDEFYAFAAGEPVLAKLVQELRGLRPPIAVEPFESLVTSITAQQVSLHAAFRGQEPSHRALRSPRRARLRVSGPRPDRAR